MVVARLFRHLLFPCLLAGVLPALAYGKEAPGTAPEAREYTVAIIPIMPPAEVKRRWQPALDEVTRLSGLHFQLHFYPDFAHFEQGLNHEEVDFAVGNPVLTWKLRDRYRPLLRGRTPLVAQVVVRRESTFQQLGDLEKHTLGLQEGASLSTSSDSIGTVSTISRSRTR